MRSGGTVATITGTGQRPWSVQAWLPISLTVVAVASLCLGLAADLWFMPGVWSSQSGDGSLFIPGWTRWWFQILAVIPLVVGVVTAPTGRTPHTSAWRGPRPWGIALIAAAVVLFKVSDQVRYNSIFSAGDTVGTLLQPFAVTIVNIAILTALTSVFVTLIATSSGTRPD